MPNGFNSSGAPLSPPGALSKRTDMPTQGAMTVPDAAYGEQKDMREIQAGAPQAGIAPPPGIFAPSDRPMEPVTAGADAGAGPGMEALQPSDVFQEDTKMISKYLPQFEAMAADPETPESFRQFVRYVRGGR